jgi:hypothetical protein
LSETSYAWGTDAATYARIYKIESGAIYYFPFYHIIHILFDLPFHSSAAEIPDNGKRHLKLKRLVEQSIRSPTLWNFRPQIPNRLKVNDIKNRGIAAIMPQIDDTTPDADARLPCCFCLDNDELSHKCMWACCGVTSCQDCAFNFYTITGVLVCPWCGVAFPPPWQMEYFLIAPTRNVYREKRKSDLKQAMDRRHKDLGLTEDLLLELKEHKFDRFFEDAE